MTDADERPEPDPLAPYPTLAERDAGTLPEPELYEGVPAHMQKHLSDWTGGFLQGAPGLAKRVTARLRMHWTASTTPTKGKTRLLTSSEAIVRVVDGYTDGIDSARPLEPLTVVNAAVTLHPYWEGSDDEYDLAEWAGDFEQLQDLLQDCGSAWYLDVELRGLYRWVDPTATDAWRRTRELAEKAGRVKASENLAEAWRELYGQHPNPSASYSAAVKAVENAALDVVFPNRQSGQLKTIHQASRELQDRPQRWRFVLRQDQTVSGGQGSIDVVATMLQRFLRGETDRHGDHGNRPSEPAEAAAALHLAVVLVQWFVTGAVQPKESA